MITHFNHTLEKAEIWSVLVGKNYAGLKALFLKNTDLITDIHRNFNESFKRMKISQLQYDRLTLNLEDPIDADRLCNFFKRFTEGPNKFNPKLKWIRKTNQIKISVDIEEDYYERQRVNWWAILFYIRYIEYHQTFIDELGRSSSEASKSLLIDIRAASKGGRFLISYEGQVSEQEFDWIMGYVKTYGMDSQIYASQIGAKIKKEEGPEFILWSSGRRCRTRVTCDEPDVYAYYQDMREVLSIICRGEYYSIHGLVNSPARILLQGFCLLEKSINSISYSPDEDMVYLRMKEEKLAEGIELITTFRDALGLPSLKFDNEEGILSISISKGSSFNYNHQIFNLTVLHLFAWWLSIKRSSVPEALFPIEHPKPRVSRPDLALGQHHTSNTEVSKMNCNDKKPLNEIVIACLNGLFSLRVPRRGSPLLGDLKSDFDELRQMMTFIPPTPGYSNIIDLCNKIEIGEGSGKNLMIDFYPIGFTKDLLDKIYKLIFVESGKIDQRELEGVFNLSQSVRHGLDVVSLKINMGYINFKQTIIETNLMIMFIVMVYDSYSSRDQQRSTSRPFWADQPSTDSRYYDRARPSRVERSGVRTDMAPIREFDQDAIELITHRARKIDIAIKALIQVLHVESFNSNSVSDDVNDIVYGIDNLFEYFQPYVGFRRSSEYPNVKHRTSLTDYISYWSRVAAKITQIIDPTSNNQPDVFNLVEIEKWIFLKELDMYVHVISCFNEIESNEEPKDA